jgi:hypothetical protein
MNKTYHIRFAITSGSFKLIPRGVVGDCFAKAYPLQKSCDLSICHSRVGGNPLWTVRWIPAVVYRHEDGGRNDTQKVQTHCA